MAVREFHGVILNQSETALFRNNDSVDDGQWQEPFLPSKVPGAGKIESAHEGEWRSESDGVATGTSGWARWAVAVEEFVGIVHNEYIQVNWSLPFLGEPGLSWGVSRNDPGSTDPFAKPDAKPPVLEIVPTTINNDNIANDTATQLIPYFFALPLSFIANAIPSISKLEVTFVVRKRADTTSSPLTFPINIPSRDLLASESFRFRMQHAATQNFVGGFPNFFVRQTGRDHFGGTVLILPGNAEFQDVPIAKLGNVSLSSFTDRIRASNVWAVAQLSLLSTGVNAQGQSIHPRLYAGAVPTFFHADHGAGIVCGTIAIALAAAEQHDIPQSQLGNVAADDFEGRFRAVAELATKRGFAGGFPTFIDHRGLVGGTVFGSGEHFELLFGAVLLKTHASVTRDILLFRDPA